MNAPATARSPHLADAAPPDAQAPVEPTSRANDGLARVTVNVSGMTCAACQARVQKVLSSTPGVLDANVNVMTAEATIAYDPSGTRRGRQDVRGAARSHVPPRPLSEHQTVHAGSGVPQPLRDRRIVPCRAARGRRGPAGQPCGPRHA